MLVLHIHSQYRNVISQIRKKILQQTWAYSGMWCEPPQCIKPSLGWWNGGAWCLASDLLPVASRTNVLVWKARITAGLSTIPSRRSWAQWEWAGALLLTKAGLSSGHTLILVAASFHSFLLPISWGSPHQGGESGTSTSLSSSTSFVSHWELLCCVNSLLWWFPLVGNNCT